MFVASRDLYAADTSAVTSEAYYVGDARELTIQLPSDSTTTVQATNIAGRTAAITEDNWSTLTTNIGGGMLNIEPGFQRLRCLQSSSNTTQALLVVQNITGWS